MKTTTHLPIMTLLLLISFASVNAVLFTPALPDIAAYFSITDKSAEQTISLFLVGYALGQLIYGPIANRYGRKPALYAGISLQILSCFLCIFAGYIHFFTLFTFGRFLLALGSGVGLKMTYTLVNETHEPKSASQKLSYLLMAFAITPGLSVMAGGILNSHFGWQSTFYACAIYGFILLFLSMKLPETKPDTDINALKLQHLIDGYLNQFKNMQLLAGGLLMGGSTCFVYVFATLAPFIAIDMLHMSSTTYGFANLLPSLGLVTGSILSAQLVKKYQQNLIIKIGIIITILGSIMMLISILLNMTALMMLFIPMMFCYIGLALIPANASIIAMKNVNDKAHGSAVMSFTNMGFTTLVVLLLGYMQSQLLLMPIMFIILCGIMIMFYKLATAARYTSL